MLAMTSRLREFQEVSHASTSKASPASVEKQEHVDALRRRRKRRRARAQALQQHQDSTSSIDVNDPDLDVWTLEATRIASAVASLGLFLTSIRRAYLDLSSASSSSGGSNAYKGKGTGNKSRGDLDLSKGVLEAWKDVKWLSDRERDEVDWQAKTTLKRCMNRVRQLEQAENSKCYEEDLYFKLALWRGASEILVTSVMLPQTDTQRLFTRFLPYLQIIYLASWAYQLYMAINKLNPKSNCMLTDSKLSSTCRVDWQMWGGYSKSSKN